MAEFILEVKQREAGQHSKVTEIRNDSRVPGIIYGFGKESLAIDVDYKELLKVLTEAGTSNVVTLKVGGKEIKAIVREYQQDPINDKLTHVDFMSIDNKRPIITFVPVEFVGTSKAVREQGGKLNQKTTKVKVQCLPEYLPGKIEVDVSVLAEMGQKLLVSDLQKDENVTILNNPLDPVVDVTVPKLIEIQETTAEVPAEGEVKEGEEGATPAEGEAKDDKSADDKSADDKK